MNDTKVTKSDDTTRYEGSTLFPAVDVVEDVAGITLYADLPGVPKNKLNVRVEADALSIEGELELPLAANMEATHAEVYLPRYHRAFTLGQELDRDKVTAEFKHGVLKLHIPKADHAKPRKVAINVT